MASECNCWFQVAIELNEVDLYTDQTFNSNIYIKNKRKKEKLLIPLYKKKH